MERTYKHISREAHGTFYNAAGLVDGLDANLELVNVVKGIKDSEDVDTVLLSLLDKMLDGVVGEGRVGDAVGTTKEHLEGDVGNQLAHAA